MRDGLTALAAQLGLSRVTALTAATQGAPVDLLGVDTSTLFVHVSASTVLDANNSLTFGIDEADADASGNPVNWTPCSALKIIGDRAASALGYYKVGVLSIKRFVRLNVGVVGAPNATVSAIAIQSHLKAEGKGW